MSFLFYKNIQMKKNLYIQFETNFFDKIINKKRVEMTALKINLTRLFNENPKGGMVIQADNDSDIETVAKIADIAREIGISPVAVSVEND